MTPLELSVWPHLYSEGVGPVLLMLHGTGSSEEEIAGLAARIDPAAAVLAPRGRVSENGATRWFRRLAEGVFDVNDVIVRAGELAEFLGWARAEYGLKDREIVPVGFSNGANIALALALLHPGVAPRAVAFSGMYPLGDRDAPNPLVQSSVLLLNGASDAMAPPASVDRLADQLAARGAQVERVTRAGGHGITEEELVSARRWLTRDASVHGI
ncbi:alpha/beta hydrolase [soil metagenome]